jgi:chitinase
MKAFVLFICLTWLAVHTLAQASPFDSCPVRCSKKSPDPSTWTHLHGVSALKRCEEPVLFDTAIHIPVDDPNHSVTIRACKASEKSTQVDEPLESIKISKRFVNTTSAEGCLSGAELRQQKANAHLIRWGPSGSENFAEVLTAAEELHKYITDDPNCKTTAMFAQVGKTVVGMYIGTELEKQGAAALLQKFIDAAKTAGSPSRMSAQICGDKVPSTWMFGVFADTKGNITLVQDALSTWSEAKCISGFDSEEVWQDVDLPVYRAIDVPLNRGLLQPNAQIGNGTIQNGQPPQNQTLKRSIILPRAECKPIQAVPGDGCWTLAQRCGIQQPDFEKYNSRVNNLCGSIQDKQWFCCSAGDLPDMSPKPNPDGSCVAFQLGQELCWDLMQKYYLTEDMINQRNKNTWAWEGCGSLKPGQIICLSTGTPPMPNTVENAQCGPQKLNTKRPSGNFKLADLNPCPLNACCNVWGQCGTTKDYCIKNPGNTGAPGTTQPGANSCISNCGMDIVNNGEKPGQFARVAYFEAWNKERECLHMDVTDIDKKVHTHIHFAFGSITKDFKVDVSKVQEQFDKFKAMTGIKKILSFGGWAFSTEAPTYSIFRQGVTPENRNTFATNVVNFVNANNLDGVDFDWEYPAAPDLPDIPAGILQEGRDYLDFLKLVRSRISGGSKSLSIAAPASFWYLKGFPIKEIGEVIDYMIYMTYDLHGQWDYGNKWSR